MWDQLRSHFTSGYGTDETKEKMRKMRKKRALSKAVEFTSMCGLLEELSVASSAFSFAVHH